MGTIERRDTPENECLGAVVKAGWGDVVWHQRADGLRAFVRLSEAGDRLQGAVSLLEKAAQQLAWSELFDDEKSETINEINAYLSTLGGQ